MSACGMFGPAGPWIRFLHISVTHSSQEISCSSIQSALTASSAHANMLQKYLLLSVIGLFLPKDSVYSVDVTMRESVVVGDVGATVILPCSYRTSPASGFNIQWKFAAGNTLPSKGAQIYYYSNGVSYKPGPQADRLTVLHTPPTSGDASIQLRDIRASDNGSYVCEVNNPPDFSGTGSGIVRLKVLAPPSSPSCQTSGTPTAGYDLTLQCSSSGGNPTPIFSWAFLGSKTPLLPGMMENQRTGSLTLTNLSQALSGTYRCTASNELGQATCNLTIAVTTSSNAGAIAGAIVGVLLSLLLIAALVFYFLRYRKNRRKIPKPDYHGSDIREDAASPGMHDTRSRSDSRERNENMVI